MHSSALRGNPGGGYNAFEVVSLNGRHIAFYNENNTRGTYFVHPNALGSDSNWTDYGGKSANEQIYAPFGQELVTGGLNTRFAGMSHRDQTGFDITPARDYSSFMGRWLTPDPGNAGANPSDPQTWNAYAYVRNNPETDIDPSGEACVQGGNGGWYNDNSGGQTCEQAFSAEQNSTPSAIVKGTVSDVSYVTAPFVKEGLIIGRQFQVAGRVLSGAITDLYEGYSAVGHGDPNGWRKVLLGTAAFLPGGESGEVVESFGSFEEARNAALEVVGEVGTATRVPTVGRVGELEGEVTGFRTRVGGVFKQFRLDWDATKGAHINVTVGKTKYAFTFPGTLEQARQLLKGNFQR